MFGNQTGAPYVRMGSISALQVLCMGSFWCSQEEPASALRTLSFEFALVLML